MQTASTSLPARSLISGADDKLAVTFRDLALDGTKLSAAPTIATHDFTAPRIAMMHTWLATQTEGWWRYAFDNAGIPFDYISTQTASKQDDLRSKYDVILFAPVGRASTLDIINGLPRWNNPMPWKKSDITPNLQIGNDGTDDIRPGLGYDGLEHLRTFVEKGGLLITAEDTAQFAIDTGLAPGVSIVPKADARVVGTVLNAAFVSKDSPIAFGYSGNLPVISANGMAFNISNTLERTGGAIWWIPTPDAPPVAAVSKKTTSPSLANRSKPRRSKRPSPGKPKS